MWASVNVLIERRAPVAAGAEGDSLPWIARVRPVGVIGLQERGHVNQDARGSQLTRQGIDRHRIRPFLVKLIRCRCRQSTGQGLAFQISCAYSLIVRSLENLPE